MQMLRLICMTAGAPFVGSDAYRNKLELPDRFKNEHLVVCDEQSKVVCAQQCAHSPAAGLMTRAALSGPAGPDFKERCAAATDT